MKKVFLGFLLSGVLLGGVFQQIQAQDKNLKFNINAGALASSEGVLFTLGAGLDFRLGELIMINPELQLWSYKLKSDYFYLNPGLILNLKLKNFFIGGGVISPFEGLSPIYPYFLPKINAKLRIKNIKLTLYLILPNEDFPEMLLYGANIGIVF